MNIDLNLKEDKVFDAVIKLLARHDKRAKHTGFVKCGCEDCKPFRAIIEQVQT